MQTISELKEQAATETPLVLFDCALADGRVERWSTHRATVEGNEYAARVVEHTAFEIQTASDQGVDGSPRITVVLANADSRFSEIERACGFKGAKLTVSFLFWDARAGAAASERSVVFQGITNSPDEIRETTLRLTAVNRMSLQRVLLPQIRIQRRCPWEFPATEEQRAEAKDGGPNGQYSRFFRCGYSAGVEGGSGSLNGDAPFTSCGYTREDCRARGLHARFGGLEYVPPEIAVRAYGKDWSVSAVAANQARYNDFVPMVYGTAWYAAPVVFARNDGNLTRMEVLLGTGEMAGVLTVLVNDYEIPLGQTGANMTGTGWYNVPTLGGRDGAFDWNFTDASGQPAGDPYGSMAYLSVVVPNRINSGTSLPTVKVLAQGLKMPVWAADGTYAGFRMSANPAWVLLDVLRRVGWTLGEVDLDSFTAVAVYCDEPIDTVDLNGNAIAVPRFETNLVLNRRRSAGDLVRGVRNAARLYLTYGAGGVLQLEVEKGGQPVYTFGDGSDGTSGILRRASGEPSVRVTSRSIADTPNRFTVEFQDSLNGYQQDSYSLVDADDVARAGQEVAVTAPALGIANYDQAARLLKFYLDKSVRGNTYVEFETSVKGFGIRPGDLIAVTYAKEGFERQVFRVLKMAPATNFRTAKITAQIHDEGWYADENGQTVPGSTGRQAGAGTGVPRPLVGTVVDEQGEVQLGITESAASASDGTEETRVAVSFLAPETGAAAGGGPGIPLVSLTAKVEAGGTLGAGNTFYYAVSARDAAGRESGLSFVVRAQVTADQSKVTLAGLSFSRDTAAFHVYRGWTPAQLFRIATDQAVAAQFTDTGLAQQLVAPPDGNFDHANFYWRRELQPEIAATAHGTALIGNATLEMTANEYRGMVARITRGPGAGQERTVAANDATTLTVALPWAVAPTAESWFAVAEAGWHFGALAQSSPVEFAVPNRAGETVEILGCAANAHDGECPAEISPMTRWQLGGAGVADEDVPPAPYFGLNQGAGGGTVELSGVSFSDLTNTRTISSATLTLHYADELQGTPATALAAYLAADGTSLTMTAAGGAESGSILQIDREILRVVSVAAGGTAYTVDRAMHGSSAAEHQAGALVIHLLTKTAIAAFSRDFFGSPYSGSWSFTVPLPDVRIGSAELFVTNQKGSSAARAIAMTRNDDSGLRTLSGGQYTIQVDGYLAVDEAAAPPLVLETSHAVRDIYAVLGKAADAAVALRLDVDGAPYCTTLSFRPNEMTSTVANGNVLGPLRGGGKLTLAVTSVGGAYPGADLTVVIRLR